MAFDVGSVIAHIKADTSNFKKGISSARKSILGFRDETMKVSKGLAVGVAAVGAAGAFLGKQALQQAADFEQAQVAFTTMLGSAEQAEKTLAQLADFAKKTPFELKGIEGTAKMLLAMGATTDELIPELKMMGDVSAGLSVPIERIALNFGQVRTQGKLTGRELRDFAVSGVPLIDELAKSLGKSKEEIVEMTSAGEIGFAEVKDAFIAMSGEGGKFNNLMEAQSKTLSGQISNLKDEYSLLLREIGARLLPVAKKFTTWVLEVAIPNVDKFTNFIRDHKKELLAVAVGITSMLIPALVAWAVAAGTAAVATIAATLPLIALGVAVGSVAFLVIKNWDTIKNATERLRGFVVDRFNSMVGFLENIGSRIKDAIVSPIIGAWDQVKDIVNRIKDALDFTKRHSPSVVDIVKRGVGLVNNALENLDVATIAPKVSAIGNTSTNINNVNIDMAGAFIGDEVSARMMGERIGDNIIKKLQTQVRF